MSRLLLLLAVSIIVLANASTLQGEEGNGKISCSMLIGDIDKQLLSLKHARVELQREVEKPASQESAFYPVTDNADTLLEVGYSLNSGKSLSMSLLFRHNQNISKERLVEIAREIQWIEIFPDGGYGVQFKPTPKQ